MAFQFTSFVILAEMRTGSNLLETYLNAHPGLRCHAELFNPGFMDHPKTREVCGISLGERDADPLRLLRAIKAEKPEKLTGFRLFHDHDPRIWTAVLGDPACAKIILTRNPLEMYVSRKIAAATDQWRLHNIARWRKAKVRFEPAEFAQELARLQQTQLAILHRLQDSGQTGFYIHYDDLAQLSAVNGLLKWLGLADPLTEFPRDLKKQNPEPIDEKLENPEDLAPGLARIDRFDLGRTPNFEPRRGPMLPACLAAPRSGALFMPMRGGPESELVPWLAALDGAGPEALQRDFDPGRLRDWRAAHPLRRSFTVLRHPLARACWAFENRILNGEFLHVREHMSRLFGVNLPKAGGRISHELRRSAFLAYLKFCRASLSGQTGLQPWPVWATQSALLEGFAEIGSPDLVLREDRLAPGLDFLATELGMAAPAAPQAYRMPDGLDDDELVEACKSAYRHDFERFGFADRPGA